MSISKSTRRPAVAGSFYAGSAASLREQIEWCFQHTHGPGSLPSVADKGPRKMRGLISPHAGYMASGPVAAVGYHRLAEDGLPGLIVILGPNHRGVGAPLAAPEAQYWETPLGKVAIDREAVEKLVLAENTVVRDDRAHTAEHSIEVQLPFLQYVFGDKIKVLPVAMRIQELNTSRRLGQKLAQVFDAENTLIIASSDFTHYEPQVVAQTQDRRALNLIQEMKDEEFVSLIQQYDISICGPGPIMTLLAAAREWGVRDVKLLKYGTSGDVIGDYSQVVGYASVVFRKDA